MGTPEFAVPALKAVKDCSELIGVFTQVDKPAGRGMEIKFPPVKTVAREMGIPVYQPELASSEEGLSILKKLNPDVIVVVAYGQILKKTVLDLPSLGCINVHSSLLPRWRGAAPIHWAMLAGDEVTGVTTMHLVPKMDAGDILLQDETQISNTDTVQTLHDRLAGMGAELIKRTLEGLEKGVLKGKAQDEGQVTHASKLTKEMEALDLDDSAVSLDRKVRALNPWPGTSVRVDDQRLKIKKTYPRPEISGKKGEIFDRAGMLLLGLKSGCLELKMMQWEGKNELDAMGFVNGLKGSGRKLPLLVYKSK
jgi:methionyl-tRNA formyltransferase